MQEEDFSFYRPEKIQPPQKKKKPQKLSLPRMNGPYSAVSQRQLTLDQQAAQSKPLSWAWLFVGIILVCALCSFVEIISKSAPSQKPVEAVPTVQANPWNYDFNSGALIFSPNPKFCTVFTCVPNFWKDTRGYVVECSDGRYSHMGGVPDARPCLDDQGVERTLYQH